MFVFNYVKLIGIVVFSLLVLSGFLFLIMGKIFMLVMDEGDIIV